MVEWPRDVLLSGSSYCRPCLLPSSWVSLFLIGSGPTATSNNSGADRHEQADEHGNMGKFGRE